MYIQLYILVDLNSFIKKERIGRGSYGSVWLVKLKNTDIEFALKEMNKAMIVYQRSDSSVMYERNILEWLFHPFICNLFFSFQDKENIYLINELYKGGDLRFHLHKRKGKGFTEDESKFLIASAILSLEYLRANNIIHYDIKPENFLLNFAGYCKLGIILNNY